MAQLFFYRLLYAIKLADYKLSMKIDKAIINWRLRGHHAQAIDLSKIKSILLVRNDGIGDMVITTPMIRALAQNGYQVSVMSQKSCLPIIENNPYVAETFIWNDNFSHAQVQELEKTIQTRQFDLLIDMRYPVYFKHRPHRIMLCHYLGAKYKMGWNKSGLGVYDVSINHYTRRGHYITLVNKFLEFLDIHNADLYYEFFIDTPIEERAKAYIEELRQQNGGPIIILNPYTGHSRRDMTTQQISESTKQIFALHPNARIITIGLRERIEKLIKELNHEQISYYPSKSIIDIIPLIKYADLVISPDTSIIHVVSAYQKPLVALYASGRRTPPELITEKTKIKERYHELVDYARALFFDKPNIDNGIRPIGKLLLVENSFGPNNPNAIQLMNYNHRLGEIAPQEIAKATHKLLVKT